jgi:hypothetical protein
MWRYKKSFKVNLPLSNSSVIISNKTKIKKIDIL